MQAEENDNFGIHNCITITSDYRSGNDVATYAVQALAQIFCPHFTFCINIIIYLL